MTIVRPKEYFNHGIINKNTLYSLLRSDGSIVINKSLMKAIGINETIVYSELLSRNNYFESREQLTDDGFFYNTIEDLQSATTLSGYQQRKAISSLVNSGLIKMEVRKGLPSKRYFKIIDNVEMLINLLDLPEKAGNALSADSEETSLSIVKKLDTNNTNPIIQKDEDDNGVFPDGKDSVNTDVVNAMKTYMQDFYVQRTKKKHPVLKPIQYRRVYLEIASFAEENGLDYDGLVEIMLVFFNNKTINTDYNINHFATDGIMLNRLYETGQS